MKSKLALVLSGVMLAGILAVAPARAALNVAVYDFTTESETANDGAKVTALVTANLAGDTNLVMFEREALNKALGEQAFGLAGFVNSQAAAKVGEITGVKVLVSGQVLRLEGNHLVIVANIIGTENGRLFAVKVEGPESRLVELTSDLSSNIAQLIVSQTPNLVTEARESSGARMQRIAKSVQGGNRPTVSVDFKHPFKMKTASYTANSEMGLILQKAGFVVVDGNSEQKPDVEIKGIVETDASVQVKGGLHSESAVVELTVRERRTGQILAIDRQVGTAVDSTQMGAQRSAQAAAIDGIAERLLPVLAK